MNPPPSSPDADDLQAELVAYLDGELDHAAAQRVERRLSEDADYRRRLQQLQRAWDLLDQLPRVEASDTFATTTVQMVALTASAEVDRTVEIKTRRRRVQRGLQIAVGLAALAIGFVAVRSRQQAPERRFLNDLPVVESVDLYLAADELEFVRQLEAAELFAQETPDAPSWIAPGR